MEKKTQTQKPNSYLLQQIEIFCTIFFSRIETLKIEISLKIETQIDRVISACGGRKVGEK
jgi:hypothetical protein